MSDETIEVDGVIVNAESVIAAIQQAKSSVDSVRPEEPFTVTTADGSGVGQCGDVVVVGDGAADADGYIHTLTSYTNLVNLYDVYRDAQRAVEPPLTDVVDEITGGPSAVETDDFEKPPNGYAAVPARHRAINSSLIEELQADDRVSLVAADYFDDSLHAVVKDAR